MKLLCIDTSSNTESVALVSAGQTVASLSKYRERGHASGLLRDIDALFQEAEWDRSHLEGIAIGLGPGGFTSLRIGLSTAKCLAYGLNVPLYAATTLALISANFEDSNVVTLIDAKRNEVYVDTPTAGLQCVAPDHLDRYLSPAMPYLFCGDGAVRYRDIIQEKFSASQVNSNIDNDLPQAAKLALLIDPSKPEKLASLQPRYVRPSDAEITYPDGFPDAVTQFQL